MSLTINKIILLLKKNNIEINSNSLPNLIIDGVQTLIKSNKNNISFFHNIKYKDDLINTKAGACFVHKNHLSLIPQNCVPLITDSPYKAFIYTLKIFYPEKISNGQIHKSSLIHKNSSIGKNVEIQENVIIHENVSIGENSIISSNSTIGENVNISNNVKIGNNCSISNCSIDHNTSIQPGAVIGSSGFGFAIDDQEYDHMVHLGKVIIGNNVKIGSNSTIARGSLVDTVISDNVRIDNMVHISHNVKIGNNTIIAAQSGIAGSTEIGNNVIMGGQVGISGHLKIGNNVKIAAKSGVIKNITNNTIVGGYPAMKIRDWHRSTINSYSKKDKK